MRVDLKKVIAAPDSFKGSLSSVEVSEAIEKGVRSVFPECEVLKIPIADGGEGTVDALVSALGGEYVSAKVSDPLMRPLRAVYGVVDTGRTAVIEMAAASGLPLISPEERNPMETTTYGTGELIRDALLRGCRRFRIGIGGSATNDGGTGMLQALGYRFLDCDGKELGQGGAILEKIASIDDSGVMPEIGEAEFIVACDVNNPFYGENGAAYVYAPQKGADTDMVRELDRGLRHMATVIERFNGWDIGTVPGAGAAGGLGGAFRAFLGATLTPGIRMVLDAVGFDECVRDADLVITGEGKLDAQSVMGKAPKGVLDAANGALVPVIAIAGSVQDTELLRQAGFKGVFPIVPGPVSLEEAMQPDTASANVTRTVSQIMNIINLPNK